MSRPGAPESVLGPWRHAAVLAFFLLLVTVYTYPLVLDPARLLPDHHDPLLNTWTMLSYARRLLTAPQALFHGNIFYPYGNTLSFQEIVLLPTATAGPIFALTGNPVLAYNLTILLFWALSGWAMFAASHALLKSVPASLLAAVAFTLCPYRTDYYLEFHMQLLFPMPWAFLFTYRFLEGQRSRDLALALAMVWLQALASWYYAIILAGALGLFGLFFLLLRWDGWRGMSLVKLSAGVLGLGAGLVPFAWPYLLTRRELNFERRLEESAIHSADVLTYLETGVTKLYSFSPTGHIAETALFMGFTVLALAGLSLVWLRGPADDALPRLPRRLTAAAIALCLAGLAVSFVLRDWVRAAGIRPPRPLPLFLLLFLALLCHLFLEGWARHRRGGAARAFGAREWITVLLGLALCFFLLSLGPIIHYGRQPIGKGLFAHLHTYLLPLHAIRVTTRFGIIVVFALSLLAGFGLRWLMDRAPRARWFAALALLAALAEYWSAPLPYVRMDWWQRPEVYGILARDPDDVAIVEWPMDTANLDSRSLFFSIAHGKRLLNGFSGFIPEQTREMSGILARIGDPAATEEALAALRAIHPLRYLIVHNEQLPPRDQEAWRRLGTTPGVQWLGRYGQDDLYRLRLKDRGGRIEKLFSYDYLRTRREARMGVRPIGPSTPARHWLEMQLNGRPLASVELGSGWTQVVANLPPPHRRVDINRMLLTHRYQRPTPVQPAHIGRTGTVTPVDLHVVSGGKYYGWTSQILINGVDSSPNLRGYNIVALSPRGDLVARGAFDTFGSREESARMARFIENLPRGTMVVASVKDEAAGQLTEEAVQALRAVGGKEDLRGRLWLSHLMIGVKGATPGTAIEEVGARLLTVTLGDPPDELGVELRDFALR